MVSGSLVGDTHNTCYLPVFKSEQTDQNIWYMGTLFMSNYYVVFDYSTSVFNATDYAKVGFAPKNPVSLVFE
jgi:hypothetical protein